MITDVERIAPCLPGAQLAGDRGRHLPRRRQGQARLDRPAVQGPGDVRRARRRRPPRRAQGRGPRHRRAGQRRGRDHRPGREPVADEHQVRRRPPTCTSPARSPSSAGASSATSSKKLMAQFADNLNTMLDAASGDQRPPARPPRPPRGADDAATTTAGGATLGRPQPARRAGGRRARRPRVRKIDGPATEPVDLAGVAGPAVLKRLLPIVAGLLVLLARAAPPPLTGGRRRWRPNARRPRRPCASCSDASRRARSRSSSATPTASRS